MFEIKFTCSDCGEEMKTVSESVYCPNCTDREPVKVNPPEVIFDAAKKINENTA